MKGEQKLDDKEINYSSFNTLVTFYNTCSKHFIKFKSSTGINPWFLDHFRLYFKHRDQALNDIRSEQHKANAKNAYAKNSLKEELKTIFKFSFRPYSKLSGTVLFCDRHYLVDGKHRLLGGLESSFSKLYTRTLFIKKPFDSKQVQLFKTHENSDHILSQYLLSFHWVLDYLHFRKEFNQLKKGLFSESLSEPEITILRDFISSKTTLLLLYFRYKSFVSFFKQSDIENIILTDENSAQNRVILLAAKRQKIKTYAVQHGAIFDLHPNYIFGEYEHKPDFCDTTFIWGEKFKDLLIRKGGYNNRELKISGYLQFEEEKEIILPELLTEERKVIVFATQPDRDETLRVQQIKDVLYTLERLKKSHLLVIRPHPAENNDGYFQEIASSVNATNFIIDRTSNLKGHFSICHSLITSFSTVGMEFIPYYKPLIVLDYFDQDLIGYIKEKVGVPIKDQEELLNQLKSKREINRDSYDAFIRHYFYKNDGLSPQRIIDTINED